MVFKELMIAFGGVFKAPFADPSLLWIILPVWILWIALLIYFVKYKKENLGWNTALGNGISLAWISFAVIRDIFASKDVSWKLLFVLLVLVYGGFVIYISFTHKYQTKITYQLASPNVIFFLSTLAVLWGYGQLIITTYSIIALVILFGLILLATKLLEYLLDVYVFKRKKKHKFKLKKKK